MSGRTADVYAAFPPAEYHQGSGAAVHHRAVYWNAGPRRSFARQESLSPFVS